MSRVDRNGHLITTRNFLLPSNSFLFPAQGKEPWWMQLSRNYWNLVLQGEFQQMPIAKGRREVCPSA